MKPFIGGRTLCLLLLLTLWMIGITGCGPGMSRPVVKTAGLTNLVWSDEFNGGKINLSNWSYETAKTGWRKSWNNERQDYVDDGAGGANAFISNGVLIIRALKTGAANTYTSSRLVTHRQKSWQYGLIAARIRLPYGNGMWPAFWMLGTNISRVNWPACGEIDIMEMIGGQKGKERNGGDNVSFGALHGPGHSGDDNIGNSYRLPAGDFKDGFHVFSVAWNTNGISWFVDGVNFHNVSRLKNGWVYDAEFYILLNLAVGGNWPGYPDHTTVFPQEMAVDWVRVYQ